MKHLFVLILSITLFTSEALSQSPQIEYKTDGYWQQQADYTMEIDMDVTSYQFEGKQNIIYTNNSPDELDKVFYHLYFNAFQPGSEMDMRAQTIPDPDKRLAPNIGTDEDPIYESRISILKPNEIGYINVKSLLQNGKQLTYDVVGTVLEVKLNQPVQPGEKVQFDMIFEGQVPTQIRRSGRNNNEGVALSMSQWYPKLAEYDDEGWHAYSYIAREFYGVWGNYDVKISIDKDYTIGGTGYLQNPNEIGHGYETSEEVQPSKGDKLTWHFIAPDVHDFTWAADPDYIHDTLQVENGPMLHFLYKNTMAPEKLDNWKQLQPKAAELMTYYSDLVGTYPYEQYSIIQGGDSGMEYGMCTLINGEREFEKMFRSTVSHEMAHTWFQFLLASNEAKHEWMDEGFATYIEYKAMDDFYNENKTNPWEKSYTNYKNIVNSGMEQSQTNYADRYELNKIYTAASYYKGCVFLAQLGYVIGEDNLDKTIKKYYKDFVFKHPKPLDIIRTAEKISGLELDWYLMDFTQTTNVIDYTVKSIDKKMVTLERFELMPMPIDVTVTYSDGTSEDFYIALRQMRGEKPTSATILDDWAWTFPTYTFEASKTVASVQIDPSGLMADIYLEDNTLSVVKKN
ncbi:M1 family metallopeptidase [Psychroserpens jangbogonensis]|uniref:M1 family metallopeptidase n=1 Tax=Psychroserpens jangbogonensis TaxID=1484460 RepID=UPI00053EBEAC|nr:M1 family metallopeptidase [Psychroserpens jangbogonensis]